ncbi:scavenger mRNA decapping enzyme c-term binding domain-containing protein [Phthorimaea operculella]|nr:scavenger mRNA decapping enzyme c-term binding domain-containing protein [Phthorimaea operculella]
MTTATEDANIKQLFGANIPDYIYEDEQCVVFDEVRNPQALVHFVVVPRKIIPRLSHVTDDEEKVLGHMLLVARDVAIQKGVQDGYHVIVDEDARAVRLKSIHVFGRALHHMLGYGPGARL